MIGALALLLGAIAIGCPGEDSSDTRPDEGADTGNNNVPVQPDAGGDTAPAGPRIGALIYSLSPATGPTSGGTIVAIAGAGFQEGVQVLFGDSQAAEVHFVDGGRLAAVAPAGVAGSADVVVRNPDQSEGKLAAGFLYYEASGDQPLGPKLLEAIPPKGPKGGGTALALRGSYFQTGAVVFLNWKVVPGAEVSSNQNIALITPPLPDGAVDIAVTNPDGRSDVLIGGFNVYEPAGETVPGPHITSVHPSAGSVKGGFEVTIAGSGFVSGSTLLVGGQEVSGWEVLSATEGTFTAPEHAPGVVWVAVTNPDGQSGILNNALLFFTDPPVVYALDPHQGPLEGGNEVTIVGAFFMPGMTVKIGGKPCTGLDVLDVGDSASATGTKATCTVPAGDAPGWAAVELERPDGLKAYLPQGYQYLSEADAPSLSQVIPAEGLVEGGMLAFLVGANLPADPTVLFGGVPAPVVGSASATGIAVEVPAATGPGAVDVTVQGDGVADITLAGAFTYLQAGPPVLEAVVPATGPIAGGVSVAIQGKNFRPFGKVFFGDAEASLVSYGGPSSLIVTLPPGGSEGDVDVSVQTAGFDDTTLAGAFTYVSDEPGAPTITGVTPSSGPASGGIVVSVEGMDLTPDSEVWFGGNKAEIVTYGGSTGIAVTLPAGNDGPVDVLVTTTGFEPSVLKAGFTYVSDAPGPPTIIGVTPSSGPASGGILISVEGMDLTPDSEVWFGGNKAEIVTYGGSTGIAVTLPVGNDGPVDVLITTTGFEPSVLKTGFTYVSTTEGPPTITAVTPSSGAASGGFVVAVEGSGFTESSEVWFGGTKAAIVTYGGPTGIAVMLPPGAAGAVDVMITTTGFDPSVLDGGFTYTAAAPPKAVSVLPADGPVDGGAIVVVQGSGFRPESEVWFGPTKATKLGTGSTGITVTLPPGSAGTVDVLVTTAGFDPSTLADAFTYLTPGAPKATAVVPDAGPVEGGVVVLVSGENFSDDSKVWFGPNEANVLSAGPKGISVLLPAGVAGAIDVTVITPGFGPTSLEKAFTYVALGPPKLTAIVPNEGPADGGIVIAVQGENLRPESEVWFGSKKATTVSYGGPDGMAVALPKSAVGTVDVLLLTAGHPTETIPDGFTYTPATADPGKMIVVSQVQPSTGPVAGGGLVLIKGLGFPGGALVQFGGQESQSVTWLSPTLLTAQVPAAAKAGAVDVSVTHPTSGLVGILKSGYAYITDASDPVLEGIKPPTGPAQGGTLAVVTGVGFVPGATFFLGGVPAAGSTVHDGALATLVTPPGAPGAVELVIVNPDGGWSSLDSAFVYASTDKPSITLTGLAPIQGSVAGGTTVNVTGSGFLPGTQLFVDGVPFNASLLGPTALWFQTKPHPAGLVDIAATAPDGWTATLKNAFNFVLVPPFVAAVTPDYGPTSGANDVTITGQGFHPAIEVWFGGTPAAVKTTTGTLLVVVAPPGDEGALVDVTVQNPDSLSDTAEKAYSYTDEAPEDVVAVFSVTPPTGPMSGGTPITLQGHGFAPGTTVIIGDSLASGVAVLSETTLIAVSPPGDKGPAKVQVIVPGKGTSGPPVRLMFS